MKTLNRQMRDALRPVKDHVQPKTTPRRALVARIREAEADDWIGFVRRENITPLRFKK